MFNVYNCVDRDCWNTYVIKQTLFLLTKYSNIGLAYFTVSILIIICTSNQDILTSTSFIMNACWVACGSRYRHSSWQFYCCSANVSAIVGPVGVSDGVDDPKIVKHNIHPSRTWAIIVCVEWVFVQYRNFENKMVFITEAVVLALSEWASTIGMHHWIVSHQVVI